jgi:CoA:oxalate CoA-transferase
MCEALGRPELAISPDYATNALRLENLTKLQLEIGNALQCKSVAEWVAILTKAGVPSGPINNIAQALEHPQVAPRNMIVEVPDGSGGTLRLAGNPLKMSAFNDSASRQAAPDLDGDRQAILSFLRGENQGSPVDN